MAKDSIFNSVPVAQVKRTTFDLSHEVKQTQNMGQLCPALTMEIMPGDTINIDPQALIRMQPMISPVMHRVKAQVHCFFVPLRLLWKSFPNWLVGQGTAATKVHPWVGVEEFETKFPMGSLADYLGLPTDVDIPYQERMSAFPAAAYAKIYNDWYRDETIQPYVIVDTDEDNVISDDGGYQGALTDLMLGQPLRRAWNRDYLTSCLPEPQKGDPVSLPLTQMTNIPVELVSTVNAQRLVDDTSGTPSVDGPLESSGADLTIKTLTDNVPTWLDPNGTLGVNLQAEAVDIETLRRAIVLQAFLETNARGGTRYVEHVQAHFNQRSSDARLQNSEYVGGVSSDIILTEVTATAPGTLEEQAFPIGDMAGHGIGAMGGETISFHAEEHGIFMAIVNVQPKSTYQQGLHRMWSKSQKYDYPYPMFAHLGEQAVLNKEVAVVTGMDYAKFNETWGYIPRYAEYKYFNDRVAAQMKQQFNTYSFTRIFEDFPELNDDFIKCIPPLTPFFFQDPDDHHLIIRMMFKIWATRPLPKYGEPKLVG